MALAEKLNVILSLSLNFFTSIAIIQVNKYIYINYKFPNMGLTCIHFIITFIGLLICNLFGIFKIVKVPILKMIPMSITFCGFVALTNYSLEYNTIGTYQCLKSLTTPGVMLISFNFYHHIYSNKVILSVVPVLLGVIFNSIYDLKFNLIGFTLGLSAASVTSLYQVWIGEKQKELKINALQLLTYQAPLSAVTLFLIIPFFEPLYGSHGLFKLDRSAFEWFVIISSGVIAFGVNITIYWIIGITSALTYNMSGNLKFITTIVVGSILFHDPMKLEQIVSIFMVTIGLVLYSYFRLKETEQEKAKLSLETPKTEEEKQSLVESNE
ncbi:Solute carrier family 35 member E3 [Brachionus plicatilis]|uniref:Solute carrier family 35 member E3 n=1 Tax=Brachionus plicatilis TaxID=10195 RepID=A0A3M7SX03_BRAPC|nr:Solute carrier family 35 member E3 [Brachionus plicatilis]